MRLSYIALVSLILSIFSTHAYGQVTAIKAGSWHTPPGHGSGYHCHAGKSFGEHQHLETGFICDEEWRAD